MDEIKKQILQISGERIRRARLVKGLTQTELAAKCGYSDPTTIYKIEKGKQDIPTSKIKLLCHALDIDFNYLKGDVDQILDINGRPVVIERTNVDSHRAELMRRANDYMNRASDPQLQKIVGIMDVIIGGADNGKRDLE